MIHGHRQPAELGPTLCSGSEAASWFWNTLLGQSYHWLHLVASSCISTQRDLQNNISLYVFFLRVGRG